MGANVLVVRGTLCLFLTVLRMLTAPRVSGPCVYCTHTAVPGVPDRAFITRLWEEIVDRMPETCTAAGAPSAVTAVLEAVSKVTACKGAGLRFGPKLMKNPSDPSSAVLVSGCPAPGGPACDWALKNMPAIVDAAFPVQYSALAVRRQRWMALATQLRETLVDLTRTDWASQGPSGQERLDLIPCRLSRLALDYVRVFDHVGSKAYGQYYLHDILNHLGDLHQCVVLRGFLCLAELDNSPAEKYHQEVGVCPSPCHPHECDVRHTDCGGHMQWASDFVCECV